MSILPQPPEPSSEPRTVEENERIREVSQYGFKWMTLFMAAIIFILIVGLVAALGLASGEQQDADRIERQADELTAQADELALELQCRSEIVSDHAIAEADMILAKGELEAGIAQALLVLGDPAAYAEARAALPDKIQYLEEKSDELREQSKIRRNSTEACKVD